ncbi:DsbA family protein [Streptomyces sp. NPDC094466]|uniref:DsbA family protein n=1 Tax=Streptomyces sp. NPDC094466 TaxID=3366065 RepID=UPI0037F43A8E
MAEQLPRNLFAAQPAEDDDAFADTGVLLRLAEEADGLRGPDFDRKVTEGFYLPWARRVSAAFETSGVTGMPTVVFDGRPVTVINPLGYAVTLEAFLAELNLDRRRPPGSPGAAHRFPRLPRPSVGQDCAASCV